MSGTWRQTHGDRDSQTHGDQTHGDMETDTWRQTHGDRHMSGK
jgi:hypothetical protein